MVWFDAIGTFQEGALESAHQSKSIRARARALCKKREAAAELISANTLTLRKHLDQLTK